MRTLEERSSGVLLHITALSGGEGIGDIGASARNFVDWLELAGQSWWQVLPCTPTDFGDSPYQSPSAYAGNPLLVSLRELVGWQLLGNAEIDAVFSEREQGASDSVDFERVGEDKLRLLNLACERFDSAAPQPVRDQFEVFCAAEEQHWLHDYARFCVLKAQNADSAWQLWPQEYSRREPAVLARFDELETAALRLVKVQQFLFTTQWQALRAYAAQRGVGFIGDCPIYVASDSADVWAQPELFDLLPDGKPRVVAGVPPDYFSATGQLWGNPLYLWDRMRENNFYWWRSRVQHCASLFDVTRIDHFRGFDAYWEVPSEAPDASSGCWQPGPGTALLDALAQDSVQLIAEDLGDLTASVHELRKQFGLPGMRVLQFGFDGGADNPHVPECIGEDVICYVGTHDNNTSIGWYHDLDEHAQLAVRGKLELLESQRVDNSAQLLDALVSVALNSRASLCVLTAQDLLGLGGTARFNTPGTVGGNWCWRMLGSALDGAAGTALAARLRARTSAADRLTFSSIQKLAGTAAVAGH